MSWVEEVVYQVVTPGDPDENARCCLNGVRFEGGEVGRPEAGLVGAWVVSVGCTIGSTAGPLAGGWLEGKEPHVND